MSVIDTCSLDRLARYYLPFDPDNVLLNYIEEKIESGEIIVIDKVYWECANLRNGFIIEKMPFLKNKILKTEYLIPTGKFLNRLKNDFANQAIFKKYNEDEKNIRVEEFAENADVKLILWADDRKKNGHPHRIITDETEEANDKKEFKKIPAICKLLDIPVVNLPTMLSQSGDIDFSFIKKVENGNR